ncbi:MAG TPA: ABC transporter substrate-binding protein [Gammaproteobacteria bacterium]|jgi:phospholipid transport system substrate-binding protein|nr:ABC transporter substrate-binding protein [Gammaproteobacteria bacterium]
MMRNSFIITIFAALLAVTSVAAQAASKVESPDLVVKRTAENVLGTIRANKQKFQHNPQAVFDLVQKDMAPNFDFDYAARLVLGRAWRDATSKQRHEFIKAFQHYLVNSYADALVKYSDSKLEVEPSRAQPGDERATVRSVITPPDHAPIRVDYAMRKTDGGWKAFDVSAEGVSYVMSYRNTFASEVQQIGLDALIKRLQDRAHQKAKEATNKAGGGSSQ